MTQEPGWATPPGYGNSWLQDLIWESGPVADTGTGQVVDLDFFFNVDLEDGYDFFEVAFDSAGYWITVYDATAINPGSQPDYPNSFAEPSMQYSTLGALPIEYVANGYGGFLFNEVRIRFRMMSDGAYSDEDGFFDSRLGAVPIDDVSVT